ncbi:phosphatase PAP2 family protein [Natronobacterium texcoconense]|uniref:PAP2 superfamily protein n=1 Tax=Natronobacterium texcoconense TaxID=1095778 RepID=A0A1H1IC78_NATTX|nr:phosphatase PAP2 family protein [Natronobacterium texcoconense]SDR35282.1 PAP2 superfamily protein [Natronobacterium texcoconense]
MWFESTQVETVRDAFPEWMAFLFAFFSYLGSVWFVAPAVVLAFWFWDRHRFGYWLGVVMGGYAIMVALKSFFSIARPGVGPAITPDSLPTVLALLYAPAVEIHTTTFPSGHALAGTIVWTMLALEVDVGTRVQRLVVAATMIALVSFSRIGAGVHYPIDVVAGVAVAVGYLALVLWLRERITGWPAPWRRSSRASSPTRTLDLRQAATAVFATAGVLSVLALRAGGGTDAAALLGGSIGAVLAWEYARPARQPWSLSLRRVGQAVVGIGTLAVVALVLLVTDAVVVWFLVGVAGGATVVALPRLVSLASISAVRPDVAG